MDDIRLIGIGLCLASLLIGGGLWARARRHRISADGSDSVGEGQSVGSHIASFLIASIAVTMLVLGVLFLSGGAFVWLKQGLLDGGSLDPQSFMAIIATAAAVPVAFAGSIYAIYLAILGLQGSQHQIALSRQANVLSDPLYDLSQRALSAYRRLEFLNGELITAYRSLRHQLISSSYGEQVTLSKLSSFSAYVEVKKRFRELLFDEAFVVASVAAARQAEKIGDGADLSVNEHQLRRAFSKALESFSWSDEIDDPISDVGTVLIARHRPSKPETNTIDAAARARRLNLDIIRVMSGAFLLSETLERGARAIASYQHGKLDLEAPDRLLAYMKQWMPTVNAWETGRDLGRVARAVSLEGEEFLAMMFGTWTHEEAMSHYKEQVFITKKERQSSLGVVAWSGDHETLLALEESLLRVGDSMNMKTRRVSHLAAGTVSEIHSFEGFQVVSCNASELKKIREKGGLGKNFCGAVIIDGIRSSDVHWIEDHIESALQEHIKEENSLQVIVDEEVEKRLLEVQAQVEELRQEEKDLLMKYALPSWEDQAKRPSQEAEQEMKKRAEEISSALAALPGEECIRREAEAKHTWPKRRSDFEVFCELMRGKNAEGESPNALWIAIDYREMGQAPTQRKDIAEGSQLGLFDILGGRGRLASEEIKRFTGL